MCLGSLLIDQDTVWGHFVVWVLEIDLIRVYVGTWSVKLTAQGERKARLRCVPSVVLGQQENEADPVKLILRFCRVQTVRQCK